MKIGLLSDTHGHFEDSWLDLLKNCDYLIHAGDIGSENCYRKLKTINIPIYMVRGNCDHGPWAEFLPEELSFSIGGKLFFLIHDKNRLPWRMPKSDFIIYGHTHAYAISTHRGIVSINPGSASQPRTSDGPTMAILELDETSYEVHKLSL